MREQRSLLFMRSYRQYLSFRQYRKRMGEAYNRKRLALDRRSNSTNEDEMKLLLAPAFTMLINLVMEKFNAAPF